MAKRELIEREKLTNELTESSKYHAQTSREESLLYRDRRIVREQPTITEQEIVKPYLEKLKAEIEKKHTKAKQASSVLQMNAYTDCLQMIDNLLSESEDEG